MTDNSSSSRWRADPPDDPAKEAVGKRARKTTRLREYGQPPPIPTQYRTMADAVVHPTPPPIATSPSSRRGAKNQGTAKKATTGLRLHVTERNEQHKPESKSWLSSIVVHLIAFMLIALILAPADFGGSDRHELTLSLGDGSSSGIENAMAVDIAVEPEKDVITPVPTVPDGDRPAPAPASASKGGGSKSKGKQGPRGSFFGIEVNGHQFVYVLDMSGSMRGSRYKMACDELIRSVEGLTEMQKFYVILFSDDAVQMFHRNTSFPEPVRANAMNKLRLSEWLPDAYGAGGTDPRAALRIALKMNPSAVFMLSDGEFKEKTKRRSTPFGEKEQDTFSLVRSSLMKPPIHAIAFQDPSSSENMKRLAVMTSGQYRFVGGNQDEDQAKRDLRRARERMRDGDLQAGLALLHEVTRSNGQTDAGWQARGELLKYHLHLAQKAFDDKNDIQGMKQIITAISYDPAGIVTEEAQTKILTDLFRRARTDSGRELATAVIHMLCNINAKYSRNRIPALLSDPFLREQLELALKLGNSNQTAAAFQHMNLIRRAASPSLADEIAIRERSLGESIIEKATRLRRRHGDVVYANLLKPLTGHNVLQSVRAEANGRLNKLVLEIQKTARIALNRNDTASAQKAMTTLEATVSGTHHEHLLRSEDQNAREMKAVRLLRSAMNVARQRGAEQARPQYQFIVSLYGDTNPGKIAKQRLANMAPIPAAPKVDSKPASSGVVTLEDLIENDGG